MLKKIRILLLAALCLMFTAQIASAGSFQQIAATGFLKLSDNEKWERSYTTSAGTFKIRFRRLMGASDAKKYHLIVWWNDKRIADGYCPLNKKGYQFKIYKDTATDRIFVDMETKAQVVLFGYENKNQKLEQYADSKNYWSKEGNPVMFVDTDGDLQMKFAGSNNDEYCTRYKLFWDESAKWFGYKDVTKQRPVIVVPEAPPAVPAYTPSVSYPAHSAPAPVYEEEEVYEEIYYEGS